MTISVRLSDEDSSLIKQYADLKKLSVSELIRQIIIERIEDEYDLSVYKKAMEDYNRDPVSYSHEEVKKMLDLMD